MPHDPCSALTKWPEEWPNISHVVNFWFFGLKRRNLRPLPSDVVNEEAVQRWANRLHLVDESGYTPDWVMLCALEPNRVEELLNADTHSRLQFIDLPGPYAKRRTSRRNEMFTLADLAKNIGDVLDDDQTLILRGVIKEMRYHVGFESRAEAKKRAMKALERWVDYQLMIAEIAHLEAGRDIRAAKIPWLDLFIQFQCEGVPVRDLIEAETIRKKGGAAESLSRTLRRDLRDMADLLQIALRSHPTGRPRGRKG